jgi:hypothetical protein
MKKILVTSFMVVISLFINNMVSAETQTKTVCDTIKDPKTGKQKQKCKTIKVHKKLEGTRVPEKKK